MRRIFFIFIFIFIFNYNFISNSEIFALDNIKEDSYSLYKKNIAKGNSYYNKGDFENAILYWNDALNRIEPAKDICSYVNTQINISNAYTKIGYYKDALSILLNGQQLIEKEKNTCSDVLLYSNIGDLYFLLENVEKADEYFTKALDKAQQNKDSKILASVFNNIGNMLVSLQDYESASNAYEQSLEYLENLENEELKIKLLLNIIQLSLLKKDYKDLGTSLDSVLLEIDELKDSYYKTSSYLTLYKLVYQIWQKAVETNSSSKDILRKTAYDILERSKIISEKLNDNSNRSYAIGYMAQMYESEKRFSEALILCRQAIFWANQGNYPEILYLWQWQLGKLFEATGDKKNARTSFQSAIATLNPIRNSLFTGHRLSRDIFNEDIKPVYLGLTSLLLDEAQSCNNAKEKIEKLMMARNTMELLKTAELENFFKDECVSSKKLDMSATDKTPENTAILYPIPLRDKLALLISLPTGIEYVSIPVTLDTIYKTVTNYRKALQTRPNNRFLYDSRKLYSWIIKPIEELFIKEKIDTIVVAPDGPLRLVPFSTLNDGKKFLIEKYAMATIPALSLTDPSKLTNREYKILIGGLSLARQGFSQLPGVPAELSDIKKIMDGKILISNEDYTIEKLKNVFKNNDYSLVHIATHGVFGGTPQESFLLTYDSKLTMDLLENLISLSKYREQKVELLTLSACQTALGNERAAMGLAGAAVKAGVKSVIATLWFVDDEATSLAIRDFYKQLKQGMTKAKAMQQVQKKLISQRRFWHPLYWAPFLVIGNWM